MNACIVLLLCVEQRLSFLSGVGQLPIDTVIPQLRMVKENLRYLALPCIIGVGKSYFPTFGGDINENRIR